MIPSLESLSLLKRVILFVVIIVIVLIGMLLLTAREDVQGQSLVLMLPPSKWDAQILELDKKALDEAYIEKLKALFSVWVREGLENPERPMKGATQARRAYQEAMRNIEFREQKLNEQQSK